MKKLYRTVLNISFIFSSIISADSTMAQWNSDPAVNTPVCTTPVSNSVQPQLAPDGVGGVYITWIETTDFNLSQIYAQHLSPDGNRLWAVAGIPITPVMGSNTNAQIVTDGDGGAIISWINISGGVIKYYMQKLSSSGQLQWNANGVNVCPAAVTQLLYYQLLPDKRGGAILIWDDTRNGGVNEVFAQRVGSDGTLQWPVDGLSCTPPFTSRSSYDAVPDSTGGMRLCWTLVTGIATGNDVFVQHINGDGIKQWAANGINICPASKDQLYCKIAKDTGENIIVIWQDFRLDPVKSQIYGQRMSADGDPLWLAGGLLLADDVLETSTVAKIASDTKGGVHLAWLDDFLPVPSSVAHLIGIHVDSMGTGNVQKEIASWQDLQMPVDFEFVPDFNGGAFISWAHPSFDNPAAGFYEIYDVYAQHVLPDGSTEFPISGQPVSSAPMTQYYQQMVCDSNGVAILAWSDIRNGNNFDLYAGTLSIDDALPVTWLSFSGTVVESAVLLKWVTDNEINNKGFIIQRSADGNHFDSIGFRPAANTTGQASYTFRDNQPLEGSGFYRLKQIDIDGRTEYSSIVRVNVDQSIDLSIFPNPASGHLFLRGDIANSIICIYGSDGKKIKEIRNGSLSMLEIDISGLTAGNYFVTITNANGKKATTLKFIKQ